MQSHIEHFNLSSPTRDGEGLVDARWTKIEDVKKDSFEGILPSVRG